MIVIIYVLIRTEMRAGLLLIMAFVIRLIRSIVLCWNMIVVVQIVPACLFVKGSFWLSVMKKHAVIIGNQHNFITRVIPTALCLQSSRIFLTMSGYVVCLRCGCILPLV